MAEKLGKCWNGISYTVEDRVVRITADETLIAYLKQPGKRDALRLAEEIHQEYLQTFGKVLDITVDSLAVEILIHVFADQLAAAMEKPAVPQKLRELLAPAVKRVRRSTAVIDCGERAVDSNRFVFDALAPFKTMIYRMLD